MLFQRLDTSFQSLLRRLRTPQKIQDYLETLPRNPADTLMAPQRAFTAGTAHCIEGALIAAAALWYHGERPLLLDLKATPNDLDHVVTLFRAHGCWGALSKTSHAVLRFREPIYRTVRELAMSFFHEYFLDDGRKTLRSYSLPFDLRKVPYDWVTASDDLWDLGWRLDTSRHIPILTAHQRRRLRRADPIEREAGKLRQT